MKATLCNIPFKIKIVEEYASFDCETRIISIHLRGSWPYTLSLLVHEAFECAAAVRGGRFANPNMPVASDSYVFQFDHNQYSRIAYDVAEFLAEAVPKVHRRWEKENEN